MALVTMFRASLPGPAKTTDRALGEHGSAGDCAAGLMPELNNNPRSEPDYTIRLDEPFLLLNKLVKMWWPERREYQARLHWLIRAQITHPPLKPLERCRIIILRGNPPPEPDIDAMYGGVKPILDNLVAQTAKNPMGMGFIRDDNQKVLVDLKVFSVPTKPHQGFTEIRIMEA